MSQSNQPNEAPKNTSNTVQMQDIVIPFSYLLYLISLLPYVAIAFFSVFGFTWSFMNSREVLYGFDSLVLSAMLLWETLALPVSVVYQILFWIFARKKLSARQKRVSLWIILGIILTIVLSGVFHAMHKQQILDSTYQYDNNIISAYLKEEFGEEIAAGMEVESPSLLYILDDCQQYHVKTPLLRENTFVVWVNQETKQAVNHNFYKVYQEETGLADLLAEKLAKDMGLPEDTKLHLIIDSFDPKTLLSQDTDALLESCEYTLDNISFHTDQYDREKALSLVEDFYRSYGQILLPHAQSDFREDMPSFHFYICLSGTSYVSIYARLSKEDEHALILFLCGASQETEKLIPREEIILSIE